MNGDSFNYRSYNRKGCAKKIYEDLGKQDRTKSNRIASLNIRIDYFRLIVNLSIGEVMFKKYLVILSLLLLLPAPGLIARAQDDRGGSSDSAVKTKSDLIRATREYKESLIKLSGFYEEDIKRFTELLEKRQKLYEQGIISRREFEDSENKIAEVKAKLGDIEKKMVEADVLIAEAQAAEELAKSPQAHSNRYSVTSTLIRYSGSARWVIRDTVKVEGFFNDKFNRQLPISAYGQTAVHDKLGFDHSNAIDVALHPDSKEGQELMGYLRQAGIPFLAFRSAIPGAATGAHIHIGLPSSRLATQPAH
jgi:hypothetical protein